MKQNGKVETDFSDGIATISFFHPQSNSLPSDLLQKLAASVSDCSNNPEVKVIVLRSEGEKAFCAGASFDELLAIDDIETGKKFFSGFANVINAMRKSPKFIIARVHSKVIGGGNGIVAAADYAIASVDASVKLSELSVGIGPFVIAPAVERKIGTSAFSSLTINATQWQTGQWAKDNGLFAEIHSTIEELDNSINSLSRKLSESNPEAMKELKEIFWRGTGDWDTLLTERAEISGRLVLSDFTRNALRQFKIKNR